ncbi:MAG: dihydrolipoamide acetyltransferase family protein [Verrucomicrobiota bacterium]
MSVYIEMPKLSDTMTEGTVVKWRKHIGDQIEIGDVIAEIETDKAVMELEAFDPGHLSEVFVKEGGKAKVGERLAALASGEKDPPPATETAKPAKGTHPPAAVPAPNTASARPDKSKDKRAVPLQVDRVKASPLAKKIAAAKQLDLRAIQGSGPGGRIVAQDVTAVPIRAAAPAASPAIKPAEGGKRIALTGARRIIAERLLASKTQIPHFYLNIEVDAGELLRLRAQLNTRLEKDGLGKLSVNDFVLKAAVVAATKVPRVNAAFAGDAIVEYPDIHLAVAVAIEDGLVTPVIREAQKKSLSQISQAVKDLATRARSKKLNPDEYQGGTITVSNLGSYGIESFYAVINPPQAIILAVGAIVKKPVVNARDEIVVAHRMALGLSADHRVVDGAVGAQYLAEVRQLIENPTLMLI